MEWDCRNLGGLNPAGVLVSDDNLCGDDLPDVVNDM